MIKKIVIGVLIVGGIVGGYFGVKFQIKLYNAILITQRGLADTINFLKTEFPTEVADYIAKQEQKSALPANNAPVAPKQ